MHFFSFLLTNRASSDHRCYSAIGSLAVLFGSSSVFSGRSVPVTEPSSPRSFSIHPMSSSSRSRKKGPPLKRVNTSSFAAPKYHTSNGILSLSQVPPRRITFPSIFGLSVISHPILPKPSGVTLISRVARARKARKLVVELSAHSTVFSLGS